MEATFAVIRFLHYAAALQFFGVAVFQAYLAPANLRDWLERRSRGLARLSAWALLLSGIVWLGAQSASMGEGWQDAVNPGVVGAVISATSFGQVWMWRLAILVVAVLALLPSRGGWHLHALVSMAALGSLGFIGHASMGTGLELIAHQTSQVLHMLSSGFWVGALIPLLYCLRGFREPARADGADQALRRFSGLGHLAVALVIATGLTNTWFILRDGSLDLASTYQALLTAKIVIVLTMICLAVVNRYHFVPRIPNNGPGARQLAMGTVAEIVLTGAVLGLVGYLGTIAPK